jgi:hypothetical protein
MGLISSKTHGILDYAVGILLIVVPLTPDDTTKHREVWIAVVWIAVVMGVITCLYSMFTNYELGRFKLLSMRTHLLLDVMSALLLAASPWLFNFYERIYLPFVLVGILEIVVVLLSDRVAYKSKTIEANNKAARPAHSQ